MTIPYLMNCSHSGEGWCLDCTKELGEAHEAAMVERDAAIAVAIHAGKSTFGLTDDQATQAIGRSLKAWLDPEVQEITRGYARATRKHAGLPKERGR